MFVNHTTNFWNERYEKEQYAYGTEPNTFLMSQQHRLRPGMRALAVGDGEGRNGVWLAQQGLKVLSVDLSVAGLEKAQVLAQTKNVSIQTQEVDLSTWQWPRHTFDVVVAIYLHFPPNLRTRMHQAMVSALCPEGLLIIEAFTPDQLTYQKQYQSGGPPRPEMLYSKVMLAQDFKELSIVELSETTVELQEGTYHRGLAAVVRGIFRNAD